jgi:hypothetical protein
MEIFVDPLFGALGAFLFIFLLTTLLIGFAGIKPTIITERLPDAAIGEPYEVWLSAEGGTGNFAWRLANDETLPAGLILDLNGYLHGSVEELPVKSDVFETDFQVEVEALMMKTEDPDEIRSYRQYALRIYLDSPINPAQLPPVKIVTEDKLPDAISEQAYSFSLAVIGGLPPYEWTVNPLPEGLQLSPSTGILSGVPIGSGNQLEMSVHVKDGRNGLLSGREDEKTVSLAIIPPPGPPSPPIKISTSTIPKAVETHEYALTLAASGGVPPYRWSVEGLPEWAALNTSQGQISGTPPWGARGKANLRISVLDMEDDSSPIPLNAELEVIHAGGAPIDPLEFIEFQPPDAVAGKQYEIIFPAYGGMPPLFYTAEGQPEGLRFDRRTGILRGKPREAGQYNLRVTVRDSMTNRQTDEAQFTLSVGGPSTKPISRPNVAERRADQPKTAADDQTGVKPGVAKWFILLAVAGVHWFLVALINASVRQRLAKYVRK